MGQITNCKDLLMLLLYAKGSNDRPCEPIVGKTRLMKMVFLFDKEIRRRLNLEQVVPKEALPSFEAYSFGPFSAKVYEDLEFLVEMGLVDVLADDGSELLDDEKLEYEHWQATSGEEGPSFQETFQLTELGIEFVESRLKSNLSQQQWDILDDFKQRCSTASLRSLLKYVYTKYPETTTKSTIRNQIMGR